MSISSLPPLSTGALLVVYSLQSIVSTALVKNAKFSRLSPHYIHLNDYHYEIMSDLCQSGCASLGICFIAGQKMQILQLPSTEPGIPSQKIMINAPCGFKQCQSKRLSKSESEYSGKPNNKPCPSLTYSWPSNGM